MGVLFGLLSSLAIGLSELYGRRATLAAGTVRAGVTIQLFAALTLTVAAAFVPGRIVGRDLVIGAVSGALMGVALLLYLGGLVRSSATVVAPVTATLAALLPFVFALVRGANPSPVGYLGSLLALAGVVVITGGSSDRGGVRTGLIWGTASGLCYGLGLGIILAVGGDGGMWPGVAQRVSAFGVMVLLALARRQSLVLPGPVRPAGVTSGLIAGLTTVFYLIGLTYDEAKTVVAASVFPAVSVVVGRLFFGDAVSGRQAVGLAMVITGVAGVAVL